VTTATAVAATAAFTAVVMTVVVVVTVATAATAFVVVIVVMAVSTVNVAMSQFFFGRFTQRNDFNVEFQVLASQHVVTVNDNVIVFDFGDFNRNRTLVSFSQETHANLQLVNAHEDVFRYALHQIFIILTVSVVCADFDVKLIACFVTFQRIFQARDQGTVTMQVVERRTNRRLINQHTVFCTYLIGQADHQVFCYFHDIS
jgi:hypothetical protein